jgi:hypothetical protein
VRLSPGSPRVSLRAMEGIGRFLLFSSGVRRDSVAESRGRILFQAQVSLTKLLPP